jgi:hypothetical protein
MDESFRSSGAITGDAERRVFRERKRAGQPLRLVFATKVHLSTRRI